MQPKSSKEIYIHRIDKKEIIVSVSDNWLSFAEENFSANSCNPENVVGSSLWDFIHDPETTHLYEIILKRVRNYQRPATFPFRCDSPEERRFLKLSVIPMMDYAIEFKSSVNRTEARKSMELLKSNIERSNDFIQICSMCKKIAISETEWKEVEIAMQELKLFEKDVLPHLTHGVCQSCYDTVMAELEKLR
jgi:hypothetical protein